ARLQVGRRPRLEKQLGSGGVRRFRVSCRYFHQGQDSRPWDLPSGLEVPPPSVRVCSDWARPLHDIQLSSSWIPMEPRWNLSNRRPLEAIRRGYRPVPAVVLENTDIRVRRG